MKVLVAGGAGYIGSHTCVALLEAGHEVVVVDSLVNSDASILRKIGEITGKQVDFVKADVRDQASLDRVFRQHQPQAVLNFAGFKAVGESVESPLAYYDNNLNCALTLLQCMATHDVKIMVFSSSAAVYGEIERMPITEDCPTVPTNPYGRTKLFIEHMLQDLAHADSTWRIAILRYFNPVGAHASALIGEKPSGTPNNLMPIVSMTAAGKTDSFRIFGDDYPTPDGTAIRDYIHIMDLAAGHIDALRKLEASDGGTIMTLNLGTGTGYSVLDVVRAYERVCGHEIPYDIVSRRAGDVACSYADASRAQRELGWAARHDIEDMCRDAWNWQQRL